MTIAQRVSTALTPQAYLERERAAEVRSEYEDGRLVAMAGAGLAHIRITANLVTTLNTQLKGKPCRASSSDFKVRIGAGRAYYYPDVVVDCRPTRLADDSHATLLNPTLVIEVLSPSTEARDRGEKQAGYMAIESLKEYVLVSSASKRIEVFRRGLDGRTWSYEAIAEGPARLESIGAILDPAEVYDFVEFEAEASS